MCHEALVEHCGLAAASCGGRGSGGATAPTQPLLQRQGQAPCQNPWQGRHQRGAVVGDAAEEGDRLRQEDD